MVKAQIHAGGRGKGGGVKLARTLEEAECGERRPFWGCSWLRTRLGLPGRRFRRLLIEEGSAIERELYLGLVLDRASAKVVFMASQSGGMEIEEVAHATPELIYKEYIDPAVGFAAVPGAEAGVQAGTDAGADSVPAVAFMTGLYKAFVDTDSTLMEINPFITTKDGKLVALDCKINFDDNAMFRHKDLKELRDLAEEDPLEVEASEVCAQLHQAGWEYRLHGEWRGAGDGDDGYHFVLGWGGGELSWMWGVGRIRNRLRMRLGFC